MGQRVRPTALVGVLQQPIRQHCRVVNRPVFGREHEDQWFIARGHFAELLEFLSVHVVEFCAVAGDEFIEARRVMSPPLPQFR